MPIGNDGYNRGEPEIIKTEIKIGASAPFKILHMSDTHLTFANENDDERKHALAAKRNDAFKYHEKTLDLAEKYSKEHNIPIFHTGDLIDFVSEENLKKAKKFASENDLFIAAGNHEFSKYVGEAFEDDAYRNQSLDLVQSAFNNNIRFDKREINGVNFVAIDNSYYLIDRNQLNVLKEVAKEGKPMVLLMHTPLFTKQLYDKSTKDHTGPAYLMCVPKELMGHYPESRVIQQTADAVTNEAFEYIKSEKLIKCLLAGHLHFCYNDNVTDDLSQYITGMNIVREVTFI